MASAADDEQQCVVLSGAYGGFSIPDGIPGDAMEELLFHSKRYDDTGYLPSSYHRIRMDRDLIDRTHPSLVKAASNFTNTLYVKVVKPGWEDCWRIHEYDGMESLRYDEGLYLKKNLSLILSSTTMTDSQKVEAVRKLTEEDHPVC